jgi:two-component system nitrogen regulation response regulator NtrX
MAPQVLIIDDEPALRDIMAEALAAEGYRVTTAVDGVEGLARVRERRPELIVLDLMMPVLDGWAFMEAYRELVEDETPIVGVSAHMTPDVAGRLRTLGVKACLPKPFDLDELVSCAREAIGGNRTAIRSSAR